MRLPLLVPPKSGVEVETETANQPSTQARRILVADDNADSAESLSLMLELLGHKVKMAQDGAEAVEVAKTFLPELVFLDLGMPRMNGYDAARMIRSLPECNGVVLIALTGWGQEEDKRRSQEAGFDHHIVKPIDFAVVEKLRTYYLQHSRDKPVRCQLPCVQGRNAHGPRVARYERGENIREDRRGER